MADGLALLIDGENVTAQHAGQIVRLAQREGRFRIGQVFADFSQGRCSEWIAASRLHGLEPVMHLSAGKNCADIAIAVSAMDIAHDGHVETIVLATSDRDFVPLVRRLRRGGMRVIGLGNALAGGALAMACDRYEMLSPGNPARPAATQAAAPAPKKPPVPANANAAPQTLTADECRKMATLIAGLGGDKAPISPSIIGVALRQKLPALAGKLGKGRLVKVLAQHGVVNVSGAGGDRRVALRPQVMGSGAARG